LKVGFGGTGAPAFFRAASKKLTCFASSSIISLNALLIVSGETVERVPPPEARFIVAIGVLLLAVGGAFSVEVHSQSRVRLVHVVPVRSEHHVRAESLGLIAKSSGLRNRLVRIDEVACRSMSPRMVTPKSLRGKRA
jgi:hypothetical protein